MTSVDVKSDTGDICFSVAEISVKNFRLGHQEYQQYTVGSGGASSEKSPGPGKVLNSILLFVFQTRPTVQSFVKID